MHATIDPASAVDGPAKAEDEEEAADSGENDPDRNIVILNARAAQPEDGLLTDEELEQFFRHSGTLFSAYDAGQRLVPNISDKLTFGSRVSVRAARRGSFEPVYTSYTHVRGLFNAQLMFAETSRVSDSIGRQF